ncbi:hypothetical protein, partial [Mycobacterium marinum]|uniref:hypothetical protein n=1 Tax=Mycobacterium marinum TaxID=1781 RepID=UPI00356B5EBA
TAALTERDIHYHSPGSRADRRRAGRKNTTVVSPSTVASVIVRPNSTVRTIVSATTAAADDVRSDTGFPGTVAVKA